MSDEIRGIWEHYSGGKYLVLGVGRHTETDEELVCYVPLYQHPNGGLPLQFRPVSMWLQAVVVKAGGDDFATTRQRFIYVGQTLPPKPKE